MVGTCTAADEERWKASVPRVLFSERRSPGCLEIDGIDENRGGALVETVEDLVDLALGLASDPAVDLLEPGAFEDLGRVFVLEQRDVVLGDDSAVPGEHQRVGDDELGRRRISGRGDAEPAFAPRRENALTIRRQRTLAMLGVEPHAFRASGRRRAPVVAVEDRQHDCVHRIDLGSIQAMLEHPDHLALGLSARARERHRHGGADRIGREHDVSGRGRKLLEQLLARRVVGPGQQPRPGAVLRRRAAERERGRDQGRHHGIAGERPSSGATHHVLPGAPPRHFANLARELHRNDGSTRALADCR